VENTLRKLIKALILVIAAVCVVVVRSDDIRANLSKRDFAEYWAGGRLLLLHQNPYSSTAFVELLKQNGLTISEALTPRTPPWSLPILLPLGFVNPFWGWILWTAASVAALIISVRLCASMFGRDPAFRFRFNLLAYLFAPVLGCLVLAQIGLLLLLGVVLFLKLEPDRPFLAGAALVLPFAKPHLLVLFWLAVFLWSLDRRKWAVLSGLATATVFATLMVLWFDPAVFQHYRMHLATASIEGEFIPSFPGVLRLLFFRRHFWVQFVPLVLGVIWCCTHYLTRRSNWEWRRDAAIVMAISVVCAPYGWLTDDAVLLPAILQAAVWIYAQRTPGTVGAWLPPIAFALFNGLLLLMLAFRVPLQSGLYFWSSLLWASWCLYGYSRRTASPKLGLVL